MGPVCVMATAKNGLTFDNYDSFEIIRIAEDEEVRALREDHLDEQGIDSFADAHPEFHHCEENSQALQERLAEYGDGEKLPCTRRNLELVYNELLAEGKIKSAPPAPTPVLDKMAGITLVREDALAEYVAPSPRPPPSKSSATIPPSTTTSANNGCRSWLP